MAIHVCPNCPNFCEEVRLGIHRKKISNLRALEQRIVLDAALGGTVVDAGMAETPANSDDQLPAENAESGLDSSDGASQLVDAISDYVPPIASQTSGEGEQSLTPEEDVGAGAGAEAVDEAGPNGELHADDIASSGLGADASDPFEAEILPDGEVEESIAVTADSDLTDAGLEEGESLDNSEASENANEVIAAVSGDAGDASQIIVADYRVEGLEKLRAASTATVFIVVGEGEDGVDAISNALGSQTNVSALHVLSHGDQGRVFLGDGIIDAVALVERQDAISGGARILPKARISCFGDVRSA